MGHSFPNFNSYNREWVMEDWNDLLLPWLDYWLKGIGSAPPGEGIVECQEGRYEDQEGVFTSGLPAPAPPWRTTTARPPPKAKDEVLYLADGDLTPTAPDGGSTRFRSYSKADAWSDLEELLCNRGIPDAATPTVSFISEPVRKPALVAGNPSAYLRLSSDLPGSLVAVHLFDLAPVTDFAWTARQPLASSSGRSGLAICALRRELRRQGLSPWTHRRMFVST